MMVSKRNLLFQGPLFRFHVKFQGCNCFCCWWTKACYCPSLQGKYAWWFTGVSTFVKNWCRISYINWFIKENCALNHGCRVHVVFQGCTCYFLQNPFQKNKRYVSSHRLHSNQWKMTRVFKTTIFVLRWRTNVSIFFQRTMIAGERLHPIFAQTCKTNTTRPFTNPKNASPPNRTSFFWRTM